MQMLPKGYYAIQADFETAPRDTFTFRGVTYATEEGANLFATPHDAEKAELQAPDVVLEGLPYESFEAPVFLFSVGRHKVNGYRPASSRYLLGERCGIDPNVWGEDRLLPPAFNEARDEAGESVLWGTYYGGHIVVSDPACTLFVMDGFTMDNARFGAWITAPNRCDVTVRNIFHKSPCGHLLYDFADKGSLGEVRLENIRVKDFDDLGYAGNFILLSAPKATFSRICYDTTGQLFGLSRIVKKTYPNWNKNEKIATYRFEDCYFGNMDGENGIATSCHDAPKGHGIALEMERCTFVNASRKNEGVLQPHMPNAACSLTLRDCSFVDERGNTGAAIVVAGKTEGVTLENCSFEGYAAEVAPAAIPTKGSKKPLANRRMSWTTDTEDPHRVIGTDKADFTALDIRYRGKKAYRADQHTHTKCGGTSDGSFPMKDWVKRMDEIGLDFAFVVDHRQMRGFFLPEWDTDRFVYGTEPGGSISDLKAPRPGKDSSTFHYNMLFKGKYDLALLLANFPEYKFQGDELTGRFGYPKFNRARFDELVAYIHKIGGMIVHPHPTCIMSSPDPTDYVFGEHTYFETLYGKYTSQDSFRNYDMWLKILDVGAHVYAAGGSDTHTDPSNQLVTTMYCSERTGKAAFDCMKSADYTVGAFGFKMCIDGQPMGRELAYRDGMKLTLRVDDAFAPSITEGDAYELRIYTDKGLAYASQFDPTKPQAISLEVQKRRYYRAEVMDLTHGYRVAVGNPIWLDKE